MKTLQLAFVTSVLLCNYVFAEPPGRPLYTTPNIVDFDCSQLSVPTPEACGALVKRALSVARAGENRVSCGFAEPTCTERELDAGTVWTCQTRSNSCSEVSANGRDCKYMADQPCHSPHGPNTGVRAKAAFKIGNAEKEICLCVDRDKVETAGKPAGGGDNPTPGRDVH